MTQEIENVKKSNIISKVIDFILIAGVFAVFFILCLPTLLIFRERPDEGITVWNFVGVAWFLVLVGIGYYVFKKKDNGQNGKSGAEGLHKGDHS